MIRRSTDVGELNRLLNHPRIRPHLGTDGKSWIDGAEMLGVFYLSDQGGMIFHEDAPGLWEGHYLFHAPAPYAMALGMVHAFVLETAPKLLFGRVGIDNRAARLFTRRIGFNSIGCCQAPLPCEIFVWQRRLI